LAFGLIDELCRQEGPGPRWRGEPQGPKTAHPFFKNENGVLGHGSAVSLCLAFQPLVNLTGYILYQQTRHSTPYGTILVS